MHLNTAVRKYLETVTSSAPETRLILRTWPDGLRVERDEDDEPYELAEGVYRVRFTLSSPLPDRENDVVRQDGFVLDNYRKNPVVLWCHQYSMLPIAHAVEIGVNTRGSLSALDDFPSREVNAFGHTVYQLLQRGDLRAVSVGFRPLEWTYDEERQGYNFLRVELLEHSVCPVPMVPDALIEARASLDDQLLAAYVAGLSETLDLGGHGVPVALATRALALLTGAKTYSVPAPAVVPRTVPTDVSRQLAARDADWSAPRLSDFTSEPWGELSTDEQRRIAGHFASTAALPPARFSDLALPHHRASDGAVVWGGVMAAAQSLAQSLAQSELPDEEVSAVQAHLGRHYRAFGAVAPWDREDDVWQRYTQALIVARTADDTALVQEAQTSASRLHLQLFPVDPGPADRVPPLTPDTVRQIISDEITAWQRGLVADEGRFVLADD